jgi:hypothetical protein
MPEAPERTSKKPAKRRVQLDRAKAQFEPGKTYSEMQVNILLMQLFQDHVFARRALIEEQFLDRTADGSSYWVKAE